MAVDAEGAPGSAVPTLVIEPSKGWVEARAARALAVPRAALLPHLEEHPHPLQAGGAGRCLGGAQPGHHDDRVHGRLQQVPRHRHRQVRRAVPGVRLRRPAAVEPVLGLAVERRHEPRGQRQSHHQGLLPAPRHPRQRRAGRAARLSHQLRRAHRPDGGLPGDPHLERGLAAVLHPARAAHGDGRLAVAERPVCALPRRAVHHPVPRPDLDVPVAGHVPDEHDPGEMDVALQPEPHDRRHRWLSLGAVRRAGAELACSGSRRSWSSSCSSAACTTSGAWSASSPTSYEHRYQHLRRGQAVHDRCRATARRHAA